MIRRATPEDLPGIAKLGPRFFAEANLPGAFDERHWIRVWASLINAGIGMVLFSENGSGPTGAIGVVAYHDMNRGDLVADEQFWFVPAVERAGSLGLRLLRGAEKSLRELGVKRFRPGYIAGDERLARLYQRLGYEPLETKMEKHL